MTMRDKISYASCLVLPDCVKQTEGCVEIWNLQPCTALAVIRGPETLSFHHHHGDRLIIKPDAHGP